MTTTNDLISLYERHQGKVSDRWLAYLQGYERLFAPWRTRALNLLEIGIQNGGSLEIWSQFFPQARTLVGCDIDTGCGFLQYEDPRIHVVVGDICAEETEQKIAALSSEWDIVIDDGSHVSSHIVTAFARYFPRVRTGGIFVAEDLHCSYWQKYEGGLSDPFSSLSFFKLLSDIVNFEHWGVATTRAQYLARFSRRYRCQFDESVLAQIHSVEFTNSRCVIHKRDAEDNVLGARQVVGMVGQVAPDTLKLAGSESVPPNQSKNPWSASQHFDFPYSADPLKARPNPLVAALAWRFNRIRRRLRNWTKQSKLAR